MAAKQAEKQAELKLKAIEAAIATMRNTQCYGYTASKPANFQFPTAQELLQMLKDNISIKLKDLKYKQSTKDKRYFSGFQVILSNGVASPVFTATGQDAQGLQSFAIPDYSQVKRINGTYTGNYLSHLSFGKKDGSQITKVEYYS